MFATGQETATLLVEAVRPCFGRNSHVLDAGTRTGCVAFAIADLIDDGDVLGIDMDEDAILLAQYKQQLSGTRNTRFVQGDVLDAEVIGADYDVVLSNQAPISLDMLVGSLSGALRPGGVLGIARPFAPGNTFSRWLHDVKVDLAVSQGLAASEGKPGHS